MADKNTSVTEPNGTKRYFQNNKLHRTDGPAIENADGSKAYFVDGVLKSMFG
jgi:hypothetical protein